MAETYTTNSRNYRDKVSDICDNTEEDCYILSHPTFEHFMLSWTPYVHKIARKFGIRSYDDLDDFNQDVFLAFFEGKNGRGYEKIFNPERSRWTTFFTTFIKYRLLNRMTKSLRCPLDNYIPVVEKSDTEVSLFVDLDRLHLNKRMSLEETVEYKEFIFRLLQQVEERLPNRRGNVPDYFICKVCGDRNFNIHEKKYCDNCGERSYKAVWEEKSKNKLERSHKVVLTLLLNGYTRKQIAQKLKFSEANISNLVRDISELPIMISFWDRIHGLS